MTAEVVIAGAGVAGLTTALALARHGIPSRICESDKSLREFGAGIQLAPNAVSVLDALGLGDRLDAISLRNHAVVLHNHHGAEVARLDLARLDLIRHRPGARFILVHRGELVAILAQAARDAGVDITLGAPVEPLGGAAFCQNRPLCPDLLIGADGVHSRVRGMMNGTDDAFFTGQTAYRAVIHAPTDSPPTAEVFMGPGRHLVSYPLTQGRRNLVGVIEQTRWHPDGWAYPADPQAMRTAFGGFGGPVPEWLSQVKGVWHWGLFRRPIAPRWSRTENGRSVVILGDAAHPTLPFLAQGAGMAIEDAWILAACLARSAPADWPAALIRFQTLRQPRVTRIIKAANANARNYHLRGPMAIVAHAGLRGLSRMAPNRLVGKFNWLYNYDPVTASL